MLITKKINNNVAMAQDADGHELVVFGKGIGFRQTPYELEETSQIHRVFRNVDDDLLSTINSISGEVIGVSLDIVRLAEFELDCALNPNLYLTLADHLQFAAERFASGIVMENPLAVDVPLVYPEEYDLGKTGLAFMENMTGIKLPESEACAIALHILNAEGGRFIPLHLDPCRPKDVVHYRRCDGHRGAQDVRRRAPRPEIPFVPSFCYTPQVPGQKAYGGAGQAGERAAPAYGHREELSRRRFLLKGNRTLFSSNSRVRADR
ncbi:MAG: PRD domain-containing protein [Collinsella intestinalis]